MRRSWDADADLDEAVKGVAESAFGYSGQKCSGVLRAVVVASVYDQFLTRLVEATRSLKVAPADDHRVGAVGPVIDEDLAEARAGVHRKGQERGPARLLPATR